MSIMLNGFPAQLPNYWYIDQFRSLNKQFSIYFNLVHFKKYHCKFSLSPLNELDKENIKIMLCVNSISEMQTSHAIFRNSRDVGNIRHNSFVPFVIQKFL